MSDAPSGGPQKKFQAVDDPVEAKTFLKDAAKAVAPLMIWTKDQTHILNTHFLVLSEEEKIFYSAIPSDFDARKFADDLIQKKSADCFFSMSLPTASLFFTAKFLGTSSGGLKFQIPAKIFKVQRRANFRLPIPNGYVVKAEFKDPLFPERSFSKKAIDISVGGLSLAITEAEAEQFTLGQEIPNVEIFLKTRKFKCTAVVRYTAALPGGGGGKLGLQFLQINPADAQHIASYVMEESRKFLMNALSEFQG